MKKLTRDEISNCIGYKSLLIAKDRQGNIVRVSSPQILSAWNWDGSTWTLQSNKEPTVDNTNGIYISFNAKQAHKYLGTLCKVILSGIVVIGETGARGQFARVLEFGQDKNNRYSRFSIGG